MSKRVTVIGAGTMGNGIAHVFAQAGHQVIMMDRSAEALERALATIGKNMDRMVAKERISSADKDAALGRLTTSTELASTLLRLRGASWPPTPAPFPSPKSPRRRAGLTA